MIKALTLAILLIGTPTQPYEMSDVEFKAACYGLALHYEPAITSCVDLLPPIVVETKLLDDYAPPGYIVNGMFVHGEGVIYINPKLKNKSTTRMHEAVHYILHWSGTPVSRCKSEELARKVAGQGWGKSMQEQYKCALPVPLKYTVQV